LAKRNIKATFFVVGSRVAEDDTYLKEAYASGHQIACHTWSHPPLTTITNQQVVMEAYWCLKAVYDSIGVAPVYFRPPYGDIDARVRAVLQAMGLKVVVWNIDSSKSFNQTTRRMQTLPFPTSRTG
jgi:peptidoglycan/xylan/chitin deacetylase (PgdA/CDA1 family)